LERWNITFFCTCCNNRSELEERILEGVVPLLYGHTHPLKGVEDSGPEILPLGPGHSTCHCLYLLYRQVGKPADIVDGFKKRIVNLTF
jgi:hypothetical protein